MNGTEEMVAALKRPHPPPVRARKACKRPCQVSPDCDTKKRFSVITSSVTVSALTGPLMKDLLDLTKELIRFKSMLSRPDEINRCVEFIERFLKDVGATCKRMECDGV